MMSSSQKSHRDREGRATARARSTSTGVAGLGALLLSCVVACGEGGAPSESTVDPDTTPERWFVELDATPTVRGGTHKAMTDKVVSFRQAATAASIPFVERRRFGTLWPGLSVEVPRGEVEKLRALPGVRAVYPVQTIPRPERPVAVWSRPRPEMNTSAGMIGADIARSELGLTGRGVKVAVIDTGIDYHHPDLGNGCFGPGCRVGFGYDLVGDSYDAADGGSPPIPDNDPDDCGGHGTHVAGTVGASGTITGVAPEAILGAYRVFGCDGSTSSDIMLEAMERAYADGARVVNMSIGAAFQWPDYPTAVGVTALTERGVVVAVSFGNSGASGLYSGSAPGAGVDAIGTAAIDNTHEYLPAFSISDDNRLIGYGPATGAPPPPTSGSLPVARTGTVTTADDGCNPLPADSLTGRAALIRRGTCAFALKAINAQNAGAAAVILYNNQPGSVSPTVVNDPPVTIPVVMISQVQGAELNARMDQPGFTLTMTWTDDNTSVPLLTAGLVSSFSSSGPAATLDFKPDLAAPGGSIYSTYPLEEGGYASLNGTSMASPHVAGAAALLIQHRPGIRPAEIRDILQNTAVPVNAVSVRTSLETTVRQGAGMIHVDAAAQVKAVVTPAKLALGEGNDAVTRTLKVKNLGDAEITYTLSHTPTVSVTGGTTFVPVFGAAGAAAAEFSAPTVTVPAGGEATFDVTITPDAGLAEKGLYGGYVVLTPAEGITLRVPYMGFKGDYQSIQVLAPGAFGFPLLAAKDGEDVFPVPPGTEFTMVGGDIPYVLVHLGHYARRLHIDVTDSRGKPWGRVSTDEYVGHNSSATSFEDLGWDGTTTLNRRTVRVPNGTYLLKVSALKALGDENNPAHWETWTSPPVIVNRP